MKWIGIISTNGLGSNQDNDIHITLYKYKCRSSVEGNRSI